jgi:hypothetical protein
VAVRARAAIESGIAKRESASGAFDVTAVTVVALCTRPFTSTSIWRGYFKDPAGVQRVSICAVDRSPRTGSSVTTSMTVRYPLARSK